MMGIPYAQFCSEIHRLTGLDLCRYRPDQIERRLQGYMARYQVEDYLSLLEVLRRDHTHQDEFLEWVTIGVSEFFRNPDRFAELRETYLPPLLSLAPAGLSVWSAGCADGPEPYSVAILLEELDPLGSHHVLATDIDRPGLERAEAALYGEEVLAQVDIARRARYFQPHGPLWEVTPLVRRRVTFRVHDLLSEVYPRPHHLVLCRNVLIYFQDETKREILSRLAGSLVPGGILFLGATEMIRDSTSLGLHYLSPCFYRRE